MKKAVKILLPFFLVFVLIGSITTHAAYGVTIGQTFNYDVVAASWDIAIDADSSTGTGVNFLEVNRPVGTQFEVEVTAVDPSSVDWEMTIGTDTDTGSNTAIDALAVIFLLFFPLLMPESSVIFWNQTANDLGLEIMTFLFLDPVTFGPLFTDLVEEGIVTDYYSGTEYNFDNVGGTFDDSGNPAVFEWHFDMTYVNGSDNFAGDFVWQYAYDTTDGHMKGHYLNMDYSGTMGGIDMSFKFSQKVEEVGYNLPGANVIPGFEWFIAIPIVALLGGIAIIRRKRK